MKPETNKLFKECVKAIGNAAVAIRTGQPTPYDSVYYTALIQDLQDPLLAPASDIVTLALVTLQDIMLWFEQNPDKIFSPENQAELNQESLTVVGEPISEAELARNALWIEVMTELGKFLKGEDLN
jgi:hypothetical protein